MPGSPSHTCSEPADLWRSISVSCTAAKQLLYLRALMPMQVALAASPMRSSATLSREYRTCVSVPPSSLKVKQSVEPPSSGFSHVTLRHR